MDTPRARTRVLAWPGFLYLANIAAQPSPPRGYGDAAGDAADDADDDDDDDADADADDDDDDDDDADDDADDGGAAFLFHHLLTRFGSTPVKPSASPGN